MFSHLQSMFGNLGCFTVFPQHIWSKSEFQQITLSVMCFSKCVIWQTTVIVIRRAEGCFSLRWYSDRGIIWQQHPEIHLVGTEACVALKEENVELGLTISNGTCWGGWRNDVGADFPGHLLQWSKFLQIIWFKQFDRKKNCLPFHLSSQTLWQSSRSACSRCSHEVPHLKKRL